MVCRDYPFTTGFGRQAFYFRYQFAHISRPMIATEQFQGPILEFDEGEIVADKNRNIRWMLSEGRRPDRVSAQAIIQVAAKAAFIDFTPEIISGCGNQAYIYIDRLCSFDSIELTFLQDA